MKYFVQIFALVMILGLVSCRDTKKEEAEAEAAIEEVETVEEEAAQLTEELDKEAAELEEALKELDSI